jgi:DNA-directed RNA polymerase specialized sigma24 family protein
MLSVDVSATAIQVLCAEADAAASRVVKGHRLPAHDHDDIRQDILVELVSRLHLYEPARGRLGPFLGKLARHAGGRLTGRLRSEKRRYQNLVDPTALASHDFLERSAAVRKALQALNDEEHLLLTMLTRHTPAEVGRQEGCSRATVYRDMNSLKMSFLLAGVDLKSNNGR